MLLSVVECCCNVVAILLNVVESVNSVPLFAG